MRSEIQATGHTEGGSKTALHFRPEHAVPLGRRGIQVGCVGTVSPRPPFVPHSTRGYSGCHRYAARPRFRHVASSARGRRNEPAFHNEFWANKEVVNDFSNLSQRLVPAPTGRIPLSGIARGWSEARAQPWACAHPENRPAHQLVRFSNSFPVATFTDSCGHPRTFDFSNLSQRLVPAPTGRDMVARGWSEARAQPRDCTRRENRPAHQLVRFSNSFPVATFTDSCGHPRTFDFSNLSQRLVPAPTGRIPLSGIARRWSEARAQPRACARPGNRPAHQLVRFSNSFPVATFTDSCGHPHPRTSRPSVHFPTR